MKHIFLLVMVSICAIPLNAEKVCQKCVRIREENARKAKDQTWVYYEDWQKLEGKKDIQFDEESGETTSGSSEEPDKASN